MADRDECDGAGDCVCRCELDAMRAERDTLRARLAEVERERDEARKVTSVHHAELVDAMRAAIAERDDARRVAKRLARTGLEGCATDADRDAFDAARATALAYEVEP